MVINHNKSTKLVITDNWRQDTDRLQSFTLVLKQLNIHSHDGYHSNNFSTFSSVKSLMLLKEV